MNEQKLLEKNIASNKSDMSNTSIIPLDLKNRVKERKKDVEENKNKREKKSAMTMLKAKREEKRERGMFITNKKNLNYFLTFSLTFFFRRKEREES